MLAGIDAANHQTAAQVESALRAGAAFGIFKATEGQRSTDADHDTFVAIARRLGKLVGHYHFAWLGQSPSVEADHFLAVAKPRPGDVLALDAEVEPGCGPAQWPALSARLTYVLAWLARVKAKTGASPLLYVNVTEAENLCAQARRVGKLAELTSYPLWIADPSAPDGKPHTASWPVWTLQQTGITGLDRDVLNGDARTWAALAVPGARPGDFVDRGAAAPVPQPKPAPAPAPQPSRSYPMDVVLYAPRSSVDARVAGWYVDAAGHGSATVNLDEAKAAAAAGATVIAVGGPACAALAGVRGVVQVNGKDALDTGAKLAALR